MQVGLPGAGLGNLFFLICALLTLPVELVRTLRGRGSRARWKRAVHHTTLAAFVLSVVAGTYWALQLGLQFGRARPEAATAGEDEFSTGVGVWAASGDAPASVSQAGSLVLSPPSDSILFAPVLATLTVLMLVLALTYALKRVVHGSAYDSASSAARTSCPGTSCPGISAPGRSANSTPRKSRTTSTAAQTAKSTTAATATRNVATEEA